MTDNLVGLPQEGPYHDNWTRELGGASVEFEDGAAISKISLPSDSSAVRLNNLPEGSCPESVAALLSSLGTVVLPDNVRVIRQTGTISCSADVKVEDPLFAKTVCSKLRGNTAASQVEAIPIAVPMPPGSSLHRVDCRRVHCSWHRPTRTAWLNFGSETIARKVYERFNDGAYKVLGCNVKANAPTGARNRHNPLAWTVMLTDLVGPATERDVYQAIPEFNRPRHVEMGKTGYDIDADHASAIVKSMLLEFGPLEWWEVSTNPKGKRIKAQARFFEESHARQAAHVLDNKPLSFSKSTKLTVRLTTSAKFKVSTRIYDALREPLEQQMPVWESQHLQFIAYPPHQGYRVLKLEGEDSQLVARAKIALERIVGGEVVRKDGKDLWSPNLGRNGDEYKRLKQVEQECGVVIMRDRRRGQLRLWGSEESCQRATDALGTLMQEVVSNNHVIELDMDTFEWACRGGFRILTSHLGDNKAAFDIVSTPKRILIGGSKQDYTAALAIIASRQIGPGTVLSETQAACPVCWTEAEEPIRTSCDHVYCLGCFQDLCQAEASTSTEFRISCIGAQGRCERILPLSELQELLSSAAFEGVLEASFASYIRRHPAQLRYCPTPDCGQIYRVAPTTSSTTPPTIFTCPRCLIPTCTACHSPHPGLTCAEHRDLSSGGYEALEKIKKQLGIKDCPECKTAMEKTEGCNHMTCRGCGTHICWVCMATFGTSGECYAHMNKTHGGVFDVGGW